MKFWRWNNGEIYSLENIKSVKHGFSPGDIIITYKDYVTSDNEITTYIEVGRTRTDAAQALDEIAKILEGE